jgi:transposase
MLTLMIAFLVYGLTAGFILSDSAASEAYGAHGEWLREFLVAVKKAAQEGPAWPTYPQVVQRHIEAIQYHAEEMIAARETADRARAQEQNEQVFALLRRGLDQRYFTNTDVTSLVQALKRYLPVASNYSN